MANETHESVEIETVEAIKRSTRDPEQLRQSLRAWLAAGFSTDC